MRLNQWPEFVDAFTAKMREITVAKNQDYSTKEDDVTSNFKEIAELLGIEPRIVWGVLFLKHITAIMRYIRDGRLESESIDSRFFDVANYCVLGSALVKEPTDIPVMQISGKEITPERIRKFINEEMGEVFKANQVCTSDASADYEGSGDGTAGQSAEEVSGAELLTSIREAGIENDGTYQSQLLTVGQLVLVVLEENALDAQALAEIAKDSKISMREKANTLMNVLRGTNESEKKETNARSTDVE